MPTGLEEDPIGLIHLEDPTYYKVVKVDTLVHTAIADALPKVLLVPTDDIEVETSDEVIDVTIVDQRETLTEFDEAQVLMYNSYGTATNGREVLYALATLVNESLPDGTNGVT